MTWLKMAEEISKNVRVLRVINSRKSAVFMRFSKSFWNTKDWTQCFNPLWPSDAARRMESEILVNNGSDNGLLPVGTKPLQEPMLIYQI